MGQKLSSKLKLLIITRKVDKNDAQAGFTYGWIKKFAQNIDVLKVICLEKGNLEGLPDNVEVFSLGKERGKNRLREFFNFQKGALRFIRKVDGVFCHMNPEYTILIFPYAKLFGKKIITWYSHKAKNWKVKLINILANKIVTPTYEGFGLKSKKKNVVGHGINTELFKPVSEKKKSDILRIISVGRISPIKDYLTLVRAISILANQRGIKNVNVKIIGFPFTPKDREYFLKVQELIRQENLKDFVGFLGAVPNQELPYYYQGSDLAVNLCPTGSPDKAVLEAMSCGLPVLVCNRTFISDFGRCREQLLFEEKNPDDLAKKIFNLAISGQSEEIGMFLRRQVMKNHNLDSLISKIIDIAYKL